MPARDGRRGSTLQPAGQTTSRPDTEEATPAAQAGMAPTALVEALVRIPSATGDEAEAVAFLQEQARADGFRVREDAAGNFIAEAGHGDRLLLFVGHIDTVPGGPPVRVDDGVLWGRGSVDAKGALVAAYCAARRHIDDPDLRVVVVGAVDEEGRSHGARSLEIDATPTWIINGEPSGSHGLTLGYKGIVRGSFFARSPAMHGAHPGANAADLAVSWWHRVRHALEPGDGFDDVQARLDAMHTQEDDSGMTATGRFQLRLPPSTPPAAAVEAIEKAAQTTQVHLDVQESLPAAVAGRRNALVAAFSSAIRRQGATPRLQRKTGTSDFNILHARWPDVPLLAYGPGDASLDHTASERLALADFEAALDVLDEAMSALAGSKGSEPAA